ncbi:hypothetical protein G7059_03625 [Erysipelothrix sp. HDW6A]|uniref:hypothetical protein n=1 Tax=Erysipelothrix sp. HDW6A TaxID=2714928 RepID=UPI00140DC691|nr:hypothetical protein [Erysipelothrix sp. HDW6A]QIK57001.1 hypothetical protein G7059_03625 [Erysipelothrix sp. HDW6A]
MKTIKKSLLSILVYAIASIPLVLLLSILYKTNFLGFAWLTDIVISFFTILLSSAGVWFVLLCIGGVVALFFGLLFLVIKLQGRDGE